MIYSIVLTIHNKEFLVDRVLRSILTLTTGDYELVIVFDGCSDKSEEKSLRILKQFPSLKYKIIHTPDVHETKANNAGMRICTGDYLVIVQDDMIVNEHGWNERLSKPLKIFSDVYACSAYCSHNLRLDKGKIVNTDLCYAEDRNIFAIKDISPRGPLILKHQIVSELGYLDESFSPCLMDDHDLHARAFKQKGMLCGCYQTKYISKFEWGGTHQSSKVNGNSFKDIIYKAKEKNSVIMKRKHLDFISMEKHDEYRYLP